MKNRIHVEARPAYIVFRGNVGVGKTTLARLWCERTGFTLLEEAVSQLLFVRDFFSDKNRWAFHHQIDFLTLKAEDVVDIASRKPVCQDRDLVECFEIFIRKYYDDGHLSGREFQLLERVYGLLSEKSPAPDLVVHVVAPAGVLVERVRQRDRAHERAISLDWLTDLENRYRDWNQAETAPQVIEIRSDECAFASDHDDQVAVVERIRSALRR